MPALKVMRDKVGQEARREVLEQKVFQEFNHKQYEILDIVECYEK